MKRYRWADASSSSSDDGDEERSRGHDRRRPRKVTRYSPPKTRESDEDTDRENPHMDYCTDSSQGDSADSDMSSTHSAISISSRDHSEDESEEEAETDSEDDIVEAGAESEDSNNHSRLASATRKDATDDADQTQGRKISTEGDEQQVPAVVRLEEAATTDATQPLPSPTESPIAFSERRIDTTVRQNEQSHDLGATDEVTASASRSLPQDTRVAASESLPQVSQQNIVESIKRNPSGFVEPQSVQAEYEGTLPTTSTESTSVLLTKTSISLVKALKTIPPTKSKGKACDKTSHTDATIFSDQPAGTVNSAKDRTMHSERSSEAATRKVLRPQKSNPGTNVPLPKNLYTPAPFSTSSGHVDPGNNLLTIVAHDGYAPWDASDNSRTRAEVADRQPFTREAAPEPENQSQSALATSKGHGLPKTKRLVHRSSSRRPGTNGTSAKEHHPLLINVPTSRVHSMFPASHVLDTVLSQVSSLVNVPETTIQIMSYLQEPDRAIAFLRQAFDKEAKASVKFMDIFVAYEFSFRHYLLFGNDRNQLERLLDPGLFRDVLPRAFTLLQFRQAADGEEYVDGLMLRPRA